MPGIKHGRMHCRYYSTRVNTNTTYKNDTFENPPTFSNPTPSAETTPGMQPTAEASPFNLRLEDFPPLPGSNTQQPKRTKPEEKKPQVNPEAEKDTSKTGTSITFSNGKTMNLPTSMVSNQHNITALLAFMRASERDPRLISLALGEDVNPNPPENQPTCQPQLNNIAVDDYKIDLITPVRLDWYSEDFLFYLFYHKTDVMKQKAAHELYEREWRYHKDYKMWIARVPGVEYLSTTPTSERGTFSVFDEKIWKNTFVQLDIDFTRLLKRPRLFP